MPNGKSALSPAEKAAAFPSSAKLAIAAYCYHDCHNEKESNSYTTKRAIKDCPTTSCSLWPHRGFQNVVSQEALNARKSRS